jgi:hypothetical protein
VWCVELVLWGYVGRQGEYVTVCRCGDTEGGS